MKMLLAVPLLLALTLQDDTAKAKELLDAAAGALKDAAAISFECTSTWKGMDIEQKYKILLKRPNQGRIDVSYSGQDILYVLDGKNIWYYIKSENQYMKVPQSDAMIEGLGLGPVPTLYLRQGAGKLLDRAKDVSVKKEKLGEEECDVIRYKANEADSEVWIDAKKVVRRYVMSMKMDDQGYEQVIEYGKIDPAPKVADDAFVFTPPKDSKEMEKGGGGGDDYEASLLPVDSDAPDFDATDLEGKKVKLSDFKGKPVVLNFWFYN